MDRVAYVAGLITVALAITLAVVGLYRFRGDA